MIKKNIANIVLAILLITVITLIFLRHRKTNNQIPDLLLGKPFIDVVEVKSKIAGKLVSAQEVEIKSSVSGIVEKLFLEVGDAVIAGTPIAKVKPAPEPEELENARKHLRTSEIYYEMEKTNYERKIGLETKGGIAKTEMEQAKYNMEIKELEMKASQKKLRLLLEGYLDLDQKENNSIKSTATGIITELSVKTGQSITKRNTQNEGTTIAVVANMDKLIFKGQIGEYEINKLKPGKELNFIIGAYNNLKCTGKVIRIDPQARKEPKSVEFNFEASINFPHDSLNAKTGLTVVAEFITDKTDSVICIEEKYLNYSNDSIYVEVVKETGEQQIKLVKPGISDGTKTEIISGLEMEDRLKPVDWQ